jgi:uncharacterized membrane protein
MLTIALLGVLFLGALGVLLLCAIVQRARLERLFSRVAWVPAAALLLQAIFFFPLMQALSYGVFVLPLFTFVLSVLLVVMGATLVASARQRGEAHAHLTRSTLVASIPAVLIGGYILYDVVARVVSGAVS